MVQAASAVPAICRRRKVGRLSLPRPAGRRRRRRRRHGITAGGAYSAVGGRRSVALGKVPIFWPQGNGAVLIEVADRCRMEATRKLTIVWLLLLVVLLLLLLLVFLLLLVLVEFLVSLVFSIKFACQ